jgi:hypothetical protein
VGLAWNCGGSAPRNIHEIWKLRFDYTLRIALFRQKRRMVCNSPARLRRVVCCYGDAAIVQEYARELRTLVRRYASGLRVLRRFGCIPVWSPVGTLLCDDLAATVCTQLLAAAGY